MSGYCSNNALHSLSYAFAMFIFLLNPFNTWQCYYFESNVTYTSVAYNRGFFRGFSIERGTGAGKGSQSFCTLSRHVLMHD